MRNYQIARKVGSYILTHANGNWEVLTGAFIILPLEGGPGFDEFNKDLKEFLSKYFDKETLETRVYYDDKLLYK